MNEHGLTCANMLSTLPEALANDERMHGIAEAIAQVLEGRVAEIDRTAIYESIGTMPLDLLAILAYDFKVDWWDDAYSDLEKRGTLRQSWQVHRHMGTPAAVAAGISAIYPATTVEEWFDYGGQPYHFKLRIPVESSSIDPVKHARVMQLLAIYQNTRSVLDGVEYVGASGTVMIVSGASALANMFADAGYASMPVASGILVDELNNILTDENNDILT